MKVVFDRINNPLIAKVLRADMDSSSMEKLGFRYISSGVDANVYEHDSMPGRVVRIAFNQTRRYGEYVRWAYKRHNPIAPNYDFLAWDCVSQSNTQIVTVLEKLDSFSRAREKLLGDFDSGDVKPYMYDFLHQNQDSESIGDFHKMLRGWWGETCLNDLRYAVKQHGWIFNDCHTGNIMLRHGSFPVITDPMV